MNKKIIKALLGLVLFMMAVVAQAATFYVKPDGNNGSACTSWATACLTISGAASKAAAGDKIHIAKGIYRLSATISVDKSLSFIGGFDMNLISAEDPLEPKEPTGDKYSTVITGDIQNNDAVDGYGITRHFNNIAGSNLTQGFSISNGNYEFKHLTITGIYGAEGDAHGPAIFFAGSSTIHNTIDLVDVGIIGNIGHSMGIVMAYATGTGSVLVRLKASRFENNRGDAGSGLTLHINAHAEISDSEFIGNIAQIDGWGWSSGHGVVYAQGTSDVTIKNSVFADNTAVLAAAVYANRNLQITNSTFANNISSGSGGAIVVSATGSANLIYSTIFNNQAQSGGAGISHGNTAAGSLNLLTSLILNNTSSGVENNISAANNAIADAGYNVFGYGGVNGINGAFTQHGTSMISAEPLPNIVVGYGNYGGKQNAVKITKNSPARNLIPNDGVLFYGVGKSTNYPFTSLQQAHGALTREDYEAGTYYFDLGGSYDPVSKEFSAGGNGTLVFSTWVDDNGYVLIASSDNFNTVPGAYISDPELDRRSDRMLPAVLLAHASFAFDEVRISSYSGGGRGTFDGYNKSAQAISKVKTFKTLPNAGEPGGDAWIVTYSSTGDNYFTGNARAAGTGDGQIDSALNQEIYHASGASGIHWIPRRPNKALLYPGGVPAFTDELDLWVRSSAGLCNGTLAKDARGLPRSDKVKTEQPPANCDAGAFEFNDYFQLDCLDEDGLRVKNTSTSVNAGWCFNPLSDSVNPRQLMENLGAFHWLWSMVLSVMLLRGYRVYRSK